MISPALYPFEDQYHLGINLGHDRAAAITSGGSLLVAIEQERLDRQKHSPGIQRANGKVQLNLPWNAIHYCLDAVGIDLHELASVTANSPGHDFGPQLAARCFGRVPVRRLPSHHLGHAYSAWWPSGLKDSIVLVVDATGTTDGNGLTESYTLYRGGADELELIHAEKVDATLTGVGTLGMLYEEVTRRIGFVTRLENGLSHAEAGKTMGLAPYGEPKYTDIIYEHLIDLKEDGTLFRKITDYVKAQVEDTVNISYGIFKTTWDSDQKYCYCIKYSSMVQSFIEQIDDQEIS